MAATRNSDGSWQVQGRRVTFPVRIRDATVAAAAYLVPAARPAALLSGTGLRPVTVLGRALLCLVFVDYRDNDLGAYDEVGVALLVRGRDGRVGAYVHELPVTQEFTMAAGRALWALPKWLADIDLGFAGSRATCVLADRGRRVLTATLRTLPFALPVRLRGRVTALAPRGDAVVASGIRLRARGVRLAVGGSTVTPVGNHAMAAELRRLGLPRRAAVTAIVDHVAFDMSPAVELRSGLRPTT